MKINLIEDARGSLKLFSVQVAAAWASLIATFLANPAVVQQMWDAIPPELRDLLPPWVRLIVVFSGVFGTFWLARVVKQPVLKTKTEAADETPAV